MDKLSYAGFLSLRPSERAKAISLNGGCSSFIYTQQIDSSLLEDIVDVANHIKKHYYDVGFRQKLSTLMTGHSCSLLFTQPSTRTFVSFSLAAQELGMCVEEIRDPSISSIYKGETSVDSLLTLAELSDLIVLRQNIPGFAIEEIVYEIFRRGMHTKLINGGSGSDQHPTQALLDIFTILAHFGIDKFKNNGYTVAMMGDLKHSRTVRSLSYVLSLFKNVHQVFIAPETFAIKQDILDHLKENDIKYTVTENKPNFRNIDCLYLTRMQSEYHDEVAVANFGYLDKYKLSVDDMDSFNENAIIMHPLPRKGELPIAIDDYKQAKYWEAVRNGKFVRMALILSMFNMLDVFWLKVVKGGLWVC